MEIEFIKIKKIGLITFTLLTLNNYAQTEKGTFFIGAKSSLNFNYDILKNEGDNFSNEKSRTSRLDFSPQIAYSLRKNFFVGLDFTYNYINEEDKNFNYQLTLQNVSIAPFFKIYLFENKLKPFFTAKYGFGAQYFKSNIFSDNSEFTTTKDKTNVFEVGTGLSYFFNNFINVELSLNYLRTKINRENTNDVTYSVNSNIGFYIFL